MRSTLILLCAATVCWAGSAIAQSPTPQPSATSSKGEIKALREFKLLDFNGDGQLSRNEVRLFPRLAAAFDDADTDRSGSVSFQEVQVFAVKYRAERDRKRAAEALSVQAPAQVTQSTQSPAPVSASSAPTVAPADLASRP